MIRESTSADWDAIAEVYDASKPDELLAAGIPEAFVPLREDETATETLRDFHVLVFENETGRVVGFGGYKDDYIGWLFVHRDWRKKGVGRKLLREMISRTPATVWLWLLQGNGAAYALYTREGFATIDGARLIIHGQSCLALKLRRRR